MGAIDLIAFPRSFAKLRIGAGAVRNGIECRFYGAKVAGVFIVGMRLADEVHASIQPQAKCDCG